MLLLLHMWICALIVSIGTLASDAGVHRSCQKKIFSKHVSAGPWEMWAQRRNPFALT